MKKIFSILILGFTVVVTSGCVDKLFKSDDPFKDEQEAVKKAKEYKPEPPKELPIEKYILQIHSATPHFVFREGKESEITLTGISGFDDSQFEIFVTNLEQFKDAKVDAILGDTSKQQQAKLKFTWTPPVGFGVGDITNINLDLKLATTNLPEKSYSINKSIPIFVYREDFIAPQIVSISKVPSPLKEGTSAEYFNVTVIDTDAQNVNGERPRLSFLSSGPGIDGASFLEAYDPILQDAATGKWIFKVEINLRKLELTANKETVRFAVAAISANNVASAPRAAEFEVWTTVTIPVTSWSDAIKFKIGQMNTYSFTVFDAKQEGRVAANFVSNCAFLPGSPSCSCQTLKMVSISSCTIAWNVPATMMPGQVQQIQYSAINQSLIPGDLDSKPLSKDGFIEFVN